MGVPSRYLVAIKTITTFNISIALHQSTRNDLATVVNKSIPPIVINVTQLCSH